MQPFVFVSPDWHRYIAKALFVLDNVEINPKNKIQQKRSELPINLSSIISVLALHWICVFVCLESINECHLFDCSNNKNTQMHFLLCTIFSVHQQNVECNKFQIEMFAPFCSTFSLSAMKKKYTN